MLVCLLVLGMAMVVTSQGRSGFNPLMMMALGGGKALNPELYDRKTSQIAYFILFLSKKQNRKSLRKL